jgi:hypothetical protein
MWYVHATRSILTATLAVAALAGAGCRSNTPASPDDPNHGLSADWVRAGSFQYQGAQCTFTGPDNKPHLFACGELLVGLKPGLSAANVRDLVEAVSGTVTQDVDSRVSYAMIMIRVPTGSEQAAMLRLIADPRVRYANLNYTGGVLR